MDRIKKNDKENPRERTNVFSRFFFLWTLPTLIRVSLSE